MKVRVGFVSNSSSSSFVLVFRPDVVLPRSNLVTLDEYVGSRVQEEEEYSTREEVLEDDYVAGELRDKVKEDERFIVGSADLSGDPGDSEKLAKGLGARLIWLPM